MKNVIKYTTAMLLASASLSAYAAAKISTSGRVKVDVESRKKNKNKWSRHNIIAQKAQMSLNIETEKFNAKLTLDVGQWYGKVFSENGEQLDTHPDDLARLLDEAYITFEAAGGSLTLGKQHIVLVPKMESSSLGEDQKAEQVFAIHFSKEAKNMLKDIGIDVALYEAEHGGANGANISQYDNKLGDEFGLNIILSKQLNKNLTAFLALRNEKVGDKRKNQITARGVYTISPNLQVSGQYQINDFQETSGFKLGAEYKLSPSLMIGSSYQSKEDKKASAVVQPGQDAPQAGTEFKAYGVKKMSENTSVEIYWSSKKRNSFKQETAPASGNTPIISTTPERTEKTIGMRFDVKF